MADNSARAQALMMMVLNPEQFIEMATQQGFTVDQFKQKAGVNGKLPWETEGAARDAQSAALDKLAVPPMGAPPSSGNVKTPMLPNPDPTVSVARNAMPPMGAPPLPNGLNLTTAPPVAGPTGPSPALLEMMGLNPNMGAPPMAGAMPPVQPPPPPFMGAPPTGQLPPQIPAMGNPGEVSPEAMAAMPAPQTGIMESLFGFLGGRPTPTPNSRAGVLAESGTGWAPNIPPPPTPPEIGAGLSAPGILPAPGPNLTQADLMMGPLGQPAPYITPPPPPPEVPPSGPALKPVSSAGVEAVNADKDTPSEGSPETKKSSWDALAAVGKSMGGSGGSGGRAPSPGNAGVHFGNIQQGELVDLLMKTMMKPGMYTPGFIPFGKF